ncbi:hypothetical protein Taro_046968 [Colocasia esculenta]|uniref:Uncharacterized protein n=1 Tax=Colocasia esculenta TaxID=4460 RepID=A0A843X662_COLES|nr:hypothetical protein [Colocasia esculenta]
MRKQLKNRKKEARNNGEVGGEWQRSSLQSWSAYAVRLFFSEYDRRLLLLRLKATSDADPSPITFST